MSVKEGKGLHLSSVVQTVKMTRARGNIIPLAILCLVNGLTVVSSAITIKKCCKDVESFEDFTLKTCTSRNQEIEWSNWPVFKRDNILQFRTDPDLMNVELSTKAEVEVKYDQEKVLSA